MPSAETVDEYLSLGGKVTHLPYIEPDRAKFSLYWSECYRATDPIEYESGVGIAAAPARDFVSIFRGNRLLVN